MDHRPQKFRFKKVDASLVFMNEAEDEESLGIPHHLHVAVEFIKVYSGIAHQRHVRF